MKPSFHFSIAYNSVTEHPGPLKHFTIGQKIFDVRLITHYYPVKIPGLNSFPFGENLKNLKNFNCPKTFLAFCFINLSSEERVQALKFSAFWFQKLTSCPEAIPLQHLSFDFNMQRQSLFNGIHFPYCFSRATAITLFAFQPFGKFWRFLFRYLLKNLSFNITHGLGAIVQTILPHAVYSLHIHISLDGGFCTHSRDRSHSVTNSATCRLAHFL